MSDAYETYEHNGLTIKLWHDTYGDMEAPTDWGNFDIVQFRERGYTTYGDLSDYTTENDKLAPAVQAKLRAGKMFTIDYYSYSSTDGGYYRLNGSVPTGEVDSSIVNGFIIFDDAYIKGTTYEDRKRYAQQDLETYTAWANGEVYGWSVENADGDVLESCSGYIGSSADEHMRSEAEAAANSYRQSSQAKTARELHK